MIQVEVDRDFDTRDIHVWIFRDSWNSHGKAVTSHFYPAATGGWIEMEIEEGTLRKPSLVFSWEFQRDGALQQLIGGLVRAKAGSSLEIIARELQKLTPLLSALSSAKPENKEG